MVTPTQANAYLETYRSAYEPVLRDGQTTPVGARLRGGVSRSAVRAADAALWALRESVQGLAHAAALRHFDKIDGATLDAIVDDAVAVKSLVFEPDGSASYPSWLYGVIANDAAKERDRARYREDAASPFGEEDARGKRSNVFESPVDGLWTSEGTPSGSGERVAYTIAKIVRRIAQERFEKDAELIAEIAVVRNLESALDGTELAPRREIAQRYELSEWRARQLTDRATALVHEVASNLRKQMV